MSCYNNQNSIMNPIQLSSNYSNFITSKSMSSNNNNFSIENNKLFEYIKEMAIDYNLILPSKDNDCQQIENNNLSFHNLSFEKDDDDIIDKNKLNEVMKILSKYND